MSSHALAPSLFTLPEATLTSGNGHVQIIIKFVNKAIKKEATI